MPAVGADHESGTDFEIAGGRRGPQPDHPVAVLQKLVGLRLHAEMEGGKAAPLLGEEIEEVPLRHEGDEAAMGRQMGEVGDLDHVIPDLRAELAHLLVRPFQEFIEHAELVQDLQRRGVDRVAAEIAEEILMLLQDDHVDAGAREQIAEHHTGGTAAGDGAICGEGLGGHGAAV